MQISVDIYYPLAILTIQKLFPHRTPRIHICSGFQPDHTLSQRQNRYHNSRKAILKRIVDSYFSYLYILLTYIHTIICSCSYNFYSLVFCFMFHEAKSDKKKISLFNLRYYAHITLVLIYVYKYITWNICAKKLCSEQRLLTSDPIIILYHYCHLIISLSHKLSRIFL